MKKFIVIIFVLLSNIYGQNNNLIKEYKAGIDWNNGLVNNNEPAVAINPLDDNNIVIAANYRMLNPSPPPSFTEEKIGIYYSNDKGVSWTGLKLPVYGDYTKYVDPSLDFDALGNIYCAYLATVNSKSVILVNKSTDGGVSWLSTPMKVVESTTANIELDKPYIYVNKLNNRLYVAYSENTAAIKLSYYDENISAFSTPVLVSEASDTECSGAIPITDGNNNVFVVYIVNPTSNDTSSIKIAKSTDGGNTFNLHKIISQFERIGYKNNIYNETTTVLGSPNGKYFRVNSFPSISINNSGTGEINKIYVVWSENADIGEGLGKSAKIMLSISSDEGVSWSAEKVVYFSGDSTEQFFPSISISKDGIINILYDQLDTKTSNIVYTKLLTSVDGGNEFFMTDLGNFDVNNLDVNNHFIGDYITIRSKDTISVGVWTSSNTLGNSNPEFIYAAVIPIKKSILVGNYIEDHYGGSMNVDENIVQINSSGNHILFEPFKNHTFQIVDEIYNYNNRKYKYRNWNNGNYSQNTNLYFTFNEGFVTEVKSSYKPTHPLTVNNYLEGGSGGSYDVIWTKPDPNIEYSNQISGTSFNAFDYNYNLDKYNIVVDPTITGVYGTNWQFQYWDDGTTNTTINNLEVTAPTTRTAYYKGSMHSDAANAYSNGSQRKIVRTPDGTMHSVYESMGHIWYEISTDNGTTWRIMNGGRPLDSGVGKLPAIDYTHWTGYDRGVAYKIYVVVIVYQENYGNNYKIKAEEYETDEQKLDFPIFKLVDSLDIFTSPESFSNNVNPVIAMNLYNTATIVWETKAGNGLYYVEAALNSSKIYLTTYPAIIPGTSANSTNTTIAASKAANSGGNFQIAYEENNAIKYLYFDGSNFSAAQTISIGSYPLNHRPSIIALADGSARVVWQGYYFPGSNAILVFRSSNYNHFWYFGNDVRTPNIRITDNQAGYFPIWTEAYDNSTKFTDSHLSTIYNLNTTGQQVQLSNGATKNDMYALVFNNTTSPYYFRTTSSLGSIDLQKTTASSKLDIGRGGVVVKNGVGYFFSLRIKLDNEAVKFVKAADTVEINNLTELNKYLISEPFTLLNDSKFDYSVIYGVTDSLKANKVLKDNESISYKLELVSARSGKKIGGFDDITFNNTAMPYRRIDQSYQVNTSGIGTKQVRLKLIVENDFKGKYFLTESYSDENTSLQKRKIKQISYRGVSVIKEYALAQNYPNPFNPTTEIKYSLPEKDHVVLRVYNTLGIVIATLVDEIQPAGTYKVSFDGKDLFSGMYFYRLQMNDFVKVRKMILLK